MPVFAGYQKASAQTRGKPEMSRAPHFERSCGDTLEDSSFSVGGGQGLGYASLDEALVGCGVVLDVARVWL